MKLCCKQCKSAWELPSSVDSGFLSELAVLRFKIDFPAVFARLRRIGEISELDIKLTVSHQVAFPDKCHNCAAKLSSKGVVVCSKCNALNINMSGDSE